MFGYKDNMKGKANTTRIYVCHQRKETVFVQPRILGVCASSLKTLKFLRITCKAHGCMYFTINVCFSEFQGQISHLVIVCLEVSYIVKT